jgi:hypothetical protein
MALKQVFQKYQTDFAPLYDVAPAGAMLVQGVAGSGFPLGAGTTRTFKLSATSSGQAPAGTLTQQFITLDESLYPKNYWNLQQVTGYPAEVIKKGVIYTDLTVGTPTNGAKAYLSSSGFYTPTIDPNGGLVATPLLGMYEGIKDENGFVRIRIELP